MKESKRRANDEHWLKSLRKEAGLTQDLCAKKADVTLRTWQNWESGTIPSDNYRAVVLIFPKAMKFVMQEILPKLFSNKNE